MISKSTITPHSDVLVAGLQFCATGHSRAVAEFNIEQYLKAFAVKIAQTCFS